MVARRQGATDSHPGLIPGEELETYKTKTLTAKADTAVATEALKVAELNLRDSYVRAPMDGDDPDAHGGDRASTSPPAIVMATLLRQDPMLLHFQVEPQDAPRLKPGMAVELHHARDAERRTPRRSRSSAAPPIPRRTWSAITAKVDTDNKKYWLRPGSFCDVTIDIGATRERRHHPARGHARHRPRLRRLRRRGRRGRGEGASRSG